MRCVDCAHWVTHRCYDHNRGPSDNRFEAVSARFQRADVIGECDRARTGGGLMQSTCYDEGIGAELVTAPTFGCVEFAPAPAGWDHHRFHRRADHADGRPNYVIDDTAHAEVRF